ncbi:hypothetical protein GOBAR_DD07572 [Gossypium barbadense]|nr:hypothetical protein GOBAR_DD07572 [Gossypium barbadense]
MNVENLAKNNGRSRFKALMKLDLNVSVSSGDKIEGIRNWRNKGKDITNGYHQKEEILRQSNNQLVSKIVDKGPPNELGFKNIASLVRSNSVTSGSHVGPVLINRLANDPHFRNGESIDRSLGITSEVRVGNLDPKKHMTVIFKENKEPKANSKEEGNTGLIVDKAVVHSGLQEWKEVGK